MLVLDGDCSFVPAGVAVDGTRGGFARLHLAVGGMASHRDLMTSFGCVPVVEPLAPHAARDRIA